MQKKKKFLSVSHLLAYVSYSRIPDRRKFRGEGHFLAHSLEGLCAVSWGWGIELVAATAESGTGICSWVYSSKALLVIHFCKLGPTSLRPHSLLKYHHPLRNAYSESEPMEGITGSNQDRFPACPCDL